MTKNTDIKSKVYGRICAKAPPGAWTAGDFLDFGPREAVTKALQRLETAGQLRRIEHGIYYRPSVNKLTGSPTLPNYRAVIDALARRDQAKMLVDGMTAANDLGLSDAVPGRVVIHTNMRRKPLKLGNLTVTFKLTSASKLYWAGRPAMRIVQALYWLKPKLENPKERRAIIRRVRSLLWDRGWTELSKDLSEGLSTLPDWLQKIVEEIRDLFPPSAENPPRKRGKRHTGAAAR